MQTKQLEKTNKGVKVEFKATKEQLEQAIEAVYKRDAHKYNVQGFRKGKAPQSVIEKNYGQNVFFQDGLDKLVNDCYVKYLDDNKDIVPFTYPQVTVKGADKEKGVEFEIAIAFAPSVKLGKYKGLNIKQDIVEVADKEIEEELKKEQQKLSTFETVNTVAKDGDIVVIDFAGFVGKEQFEGGTATGHSLQLGSKQFIPGFEEQLIGTKKGDKKDVIVKFPEHYHSKKLAGKDATFKCTVNEVKAKKLPKLDDEFAKQASEFDTLAQFKKSIKQALLKAKQEQAKRKLEQDTVDEIVKNATYEINDIVIEEERNFLVNDLAKQLQMYGLTTDAYLARIGSDIKTFNADKLKEAEQIIKTRLVLQEIMTKEKIKTTEDDEIDRVIQTNPSSKLDKEAAKNYYEKMSAEKRNAIKNDTLVQKLLNFLTKENIESVKTTAETKTKKETDKKGE